MVCNVKATGLAGPGTATRRPKCVTSAGKRHLVSALGPHFLQGRQAARVEHALEILKKRIVVLVHKANTGVCHIAGKVEDAKVPLALQGRVVGILLPAGVAHLALELLIQMGKEGLPH